MNREEKKHPMIRIQSIGKLMMTEPQIVENIKLVALSGIVVGISTILRNDNPAFFDVMYVAGYGLFCYSCSDMANPKYVDYPIPSIKPKQKVKHK